MTTQYDVWVHLKKMAEEQGLQFDSRSGLLNNRRTGQLIDAVRAYLGGMNMNNSLEAAQEVLEMRIPNLVSSWTGVETEAKRAVDKFLRRNPQGPSGEACPPNPDHEGGEGEETQGHGQNQGQNDEYSQRTGGGSGGDQNRQGGGTNENTEQQGERQQSQDQNETGDTEDHHSGGGQGEKEDEDENEEHQDSNGGSGDISPVPPSPSEPDVPQPEDPEYIKPDVWDDVMRVVMWNMEHPGKQKNIMLTGPRGVGKTEMVIQISKSLSHVYGDMEELPFMITAPQMEHKVIGYGNAQGELVSTPFVKGYQRHSIALIEEIDRSEPIALIAINAALANKIMDVPVLGVIEQHEFCTVIATANTAGTGATDEYVTANQLDASTRDRFIYFRVEFDEKLATKIAKGDKPLVGFVKKWNEACEACGLIQSTCSYRALVDIKDFVLGMNFTVRQAIESAILKDAMPKDNIRSVLDKMGAMAANPYYTTMKQIMESMPDTF